MVTHGIICNGDKYAFEGKDTQGILCWKASSNTYNGIYEELVNMGCITTYERNPVEEYLLDRLGETYESYAYDDGQINFGAIYKDGDKYLTDDTYRYIISCETGNAYYQKFFVWDAEKEEFVEN